MNNLQCLIQDYNSDATYCIRECISQKYFNIPEECVRKNSSTEIKADQLTTS